MVLLERVKFLNMQYSVGVHVRFIYDGRAGSGIIEALGLNGWDYIVRLDGGALDDGYRGHTCNGFFRDRVGFYLDHHHISGVIDDASEISEADLNTLLD